MNREKIKKLLPLYIEGELDQSQMKMVEEALEKDGELKKEAQALKRTWELLDEAPDIEPEPNYMSRFWTRVSTEKPWYEKMILGVRDFVFTPKLAPVMVTACVLIVVGYLSFQNIYAPANFEEVASLSEDEIQMVEEMELVEHYEIIEELEFLEDFEIIENLDTLET